MTASPSSPGSEARVLYPQEGTVLNHRHGRRVGQELAIPVQVFWPQGVGRKASIGGQVVAGSDGHYSGEVTLMAAEQEIEVRADGPEGEVIARTRVIYDRDSQPRYRVAIDDNIFFLEAIARERPSSLFDHFYLQGLRELHRKYGARFALNVFFETPDGGFSIDRFPGGYRGEFADNADWLTLAFHARSEFPDRPYQDCEPEVLAADYDRVATEILRFAGEAAYSPTTVTHWAMVRPDAWRVLAERGTRVLSGFFVPDHGSSYQADGALLECDPQAERYDVNYCMDANRSALLNGRDLLKDFRSGILFSKVDLVCNNTPVSQVVPILESLAKRADTAEVMDLLTHEQYFWPHYHNFLPDHFARCEAAIRWCTENGYAPVFFHEGFAGQVRGVSQSSPQYNLL